MVEVWFLYVISAVLIWGINSIVDKVMLTKYLNSFSYLLLFIPASVILLIGTLLFVPINFNPTPFYFAFFGGAIAVIGYYLYAIVMKKEEASRVAALTSLYPAFVAVLAAFIVNELFSLQTYVGIAIMILGAVLISYKRVSLKKMIPLTIILIIIGTNFAYAFEQTISKFSLEFYTLWQFFAIYTAGRIFMVLPSMAVPSFCKNFVRELKSLNRNIYILLAFSSTFWLLGVIFFFYAASLGPITLVSTISITSPFVTLLAVLVISKFWPKILKEEIDRKTVSLKLVAIVLIFLGTYLIVV